MSRITKKNVGTIEDVRSTDGRATMTPARKAFWTSAFTNNDAEVVKAKLKLPSLDAAKEHIGNSILQRKLGALKKLGVDKTTHNDANLARYVRSGFTDADVKQARRSFDFLKGLAVADIQAYLGMKLANVEAGYTGGIEMLEEHGITESKYDPHDLRDAFKQSGLDQRHILVAKKKYDFLADTKDNEIKEYLGLKCLNQGESRYAKNFLRDVRAEVDSADI